MAQIGRTAGVDFNGGDSKEVAASTQDQANAIAQKELTKNGFCAIWNQGTGKLLVKGLIQNTTPIRHDDATTTYFRGSNAANNIVIMSNYTVKGTVVKTIDTVITLDDAKALTNKNLKFKCVATWDPSEQKLFLYGKIFEVTFERHDSNYSFIVVEGLI